MNTKTPPVIRWGLIDRAVALISPRAASQRYAARIALGNLRRAYDGSAKGRGIYGWTTSGKAADAEIGLAAPLLRNRMRDLVRNNPLAAKAVAVLVNSLVGTGIRPRAAGADKAANKLVDDLWARWADRCDADGHTDFHGLLSLAMRETIEGGDVFALRVRRPRSAGLVVPLQIELKEADHLDAAKFEDRAGGARTRCGIEHDSAGRRVTETSERGITINKALAWTILVSVIWLIWWGGGTLASLQGAADRLTSALTDTREMIMAERASSAQLEARVRVLENSATRQYVRFDTLSLSINELKLQAREANTLLRELAQRP